MNCSLPGSSAHWIFSGKNTGVHCHFPPRGNLPNPGINPCLLCLLFCLDIQSCPNLCDSMNFSPPGSSVHGDSPGKNTGVDSHVLFQGIFPTQGSNPGLPHCRQTLYHLSHQGNPWILEWVASPFSRGSSWPRNVSCIARWLFTFWAPGEAPHLRPCERISEFNYWIINQIKYDY